MGIEKDGHFNAEAFWSPRLINQEEKTEISKYRANETLQIVIIYIYNNCLVFLSSENKQNWKNGKV